MAREPKTKTINGVDYTCAPFIPTHALKYQVALLKVLGRPLGAFGASFTGADLKNPAGFLDHDINFAAIISAFVDVLDADRHIDLIKNLLSQTTVGGREINFDVHFQDRLLDIFSVVAFVLEVNYADFFQKIELLTGDETKKKIGAMLAR